MDTVDSLGLPFSYLQASPHNTNCTPNNMLSLAFSEDAVFDQQIGSWDTALISSLEGSKFEENVLAHWVGLSKLFCSLPLTLDAHSTITLFVCGMNTPCTAFLLCKAFNESVTDGMSLE